MNAFLFYSSFYLFLHSLQWRYISGAIVLIDFMVNNNSTCWRSHTLHLVCHSLLFHPPDTKSVLFSSNDHFPIHLNIFWFLVRSNINDFILNIFRVSISFDRTASAKRPSSYGEFWKVNHEVCILIRIVLGMTTTTKNSSFLGFVLKLFQYRPFKNYKITFFCVDFKPLQTFIFKA